MHTNIPLSALLPPKDNPRRTLDQSLIAGLAQSIKADGVLQNLLVRPEGDGSYRVIVGKRRYLALQHLRKKGEIDASYPVPVEVKDELEEGDAIRLATVENVQREQLHPMDEADAFARQLQAGGTVEGIAEKTGLSTPTVRRRLALATLCADAKKAFRSGAITRTVAEAMTLGSREQQRAILDGLDTDYPPDAEEIRSMLVGSKPSVSIAIFPRERYAGTLTTDLFADDETTYFDDIDQFLALQRQGVEELAEEWRERAAWVEVLHLYTVPWWHYRDAEGEEPAGVVINLHPSGPVEIRDGLARHEVKEAVVEATRQTPLAPRPAPKRPEFTAELVRYVACQKSAAVQAALLGNPRKAKEVAALLLLLGLRTCIGARLTLHACHEAPADERTQRSYQAVEQVARQLADTLGLASAETAGDAIAQLVPSCGAILLYGALGRLSDEELDRLVVLLPILCFGEERLTDLDTGDSLFNRIAGDLGIAMRAWWTPDAAFLSGLIREQVLAIAVECGAAGHLKGLHGWTKKQLVEELARYFAERAGESAANEADRAAAEWLPGFFRFPATKTLIGNPPTS
ncbi:MAG TPA: ParB/RepB/Spo0J family partition protein [Stellaceae bacterium]|nr:ParB/RepB/Spo0J family partition protein [Stellaceae bacterium]